VRDVEVTQVFLLAGFVLGRRLAGGFACGLLASLLEQLGLAVELGERGLLLGADDVVLSW
jgi:hypothetical protein